MPKSNALSERGLVLPKDEWESFVKWKIEDIAQKSPVHSKPGHAVFAGSHRTRSGRTNLRGSDQTECIFIAVNALVQSGCLRKNACVMVAEHLKSKLGRSRRGRLAKEKAEPDLISAAATVRSISHRFKGVDNDNLIAEYVALFRWLCKEGILSKGEVVPDSGEQLIKARQRALRKNSLSQ